MKNGTRMIRIMDVSHFHSAIQEDTAPGWNFPPVILDRLGILRALSWFSRETTKNYPEISLEYSSSVREREVPKKLNTVLFRVVQESVANAISHGKPSRIRIALGRPNRWLQLTIEDNGKGFNSVAKEHPSTTPNGLDDMQKWVESSRGIFSIRSISGGGTKLRAEWKVGGI